LLVLCAISLPLAAAVYALTGGREIADDAPHLLVFVRNPFILWQSFQESGLHSRWGSFPPLLPPLFGLAVAPWLWLPDFWAIRLGALSWSGLALIALWLSLTRLERVPAAATRQACWLFALLPSVWGAIAFIPQEEVYVSLFVLALYAAGRAQRFDLVPWLLALTALGAKYFVLILVVPLAFASPRPLRNLVVFGAVASGTLALYIGYHYASFGLTPVLSHVLSPEGSISIWALAWNLGIRPSAEVIRTASVLVTCSAVLAFCGLAWRRGIGLSFTMAASLYLTLLGVSITFPAYVLWNVPLALLCVSCMRERAHRLAAIALMFTWAGAEWSSNFFRGVGLALGSQRAAGKEVFASRLEGLLGAGFPYHAANTAFVALVVAAGIGLVAVLWRAGLAEREADRAVDPD
jgi:hypothetical protein